MATSEALLSDSGTLTDGQLLECYLDKTDAAAFEVLVRRHGAMVLGVCERVLQNCHDAEDSFQATFFVLVRKAASIVPREAVGNWLYGVAYRTALEARTAKARRRRKEMEASDMPKKDEREAAEWNELRTRLDHELHHLPEKYRIPLVLCDLERITRKDAAQRLGLPEGTLSTRLARGRTMLAKRLSRSGLTISALALAETVSRNAAAASIPGPLVVSTVKGATAFANGKAAVAGVVSAPVISLTEGVMKSMLLTKLKVATVVLTAALFGGLFVHYSGAGKSLLALAMNALRQKPLPNFAVRVIDEQGRPVPTFGMKLLRSDRIEAVGNWQNGANGGIQFPGYMLAGDEAIEGPINAVVRADGFASTFYHFAGADREKLLSGNATITMCKGEKVELRFRLPPGLNWPAKLIPDVYFAEQQPAVRNDWQNWQLMHRRPDWQLKLNPSYFDLNFLNAKRREAGVFDLQLTRGSEPFYVGIYSPGFLQFFESGPFTLADAKNGVLLVDVPKPAAVEVNFDPGSNTAASLPFDLVTLTVCQKNPYASSYQQVSSQEGDPRKQTLRLADLAPAEYWITFSGWRKGEQQVTSFWGAKPYRYGDAKTILLKPGETRRVDFGYKPRDRNAFRGKHTAKIRVMNPDGSPAAGRWLTLSYRDGGHGYQEVFTGSLSESGEVAIPGIAGLKMEDVAFGPYQVDVDKKRVGYLGFTKGALTESFTFHLPPKVGDVARDIELVNVSSGARSKLSDLRGKVVCLEFWLTGCGPCQPAMAKLNQLAAEKRDAWRDRVAILPISIDERPENVARRVKQRDWNQLDHYWNGAAGSKGWNAPAFQAFVIEEVPTILILNRDGRIAWRGYPTDPSLDLAARIEELIEQ